MELTQDQVTAAKASGCTFIPATEEQVARLTMQRRIFHIDGSPHVAIRTDAAVKETHGAIALLLAGATPATEQPIQESLAADAEAALVVAGEASAARGAARVVRRGGPARPRAAWQKSKRGL